MYYLIDEILTECSAEECFGSEKQYAVALTGAEWDELRDRFDLGIELDMDPEDIHSTKAEVNYDSLTGTFSVPDRDDLSSLKRKFSFALDEKGVVFIDDTGTADRILDSIRRAKRWRIPCLERLLYDFLEMIISRDLVLMEQFGRELDGVENDIMDESWDNCLKRINEVRGDVRELLVHYEQLIDLGQELEENENGFFKEENLRYFHLFSNRMARLYDTATSLRDYTMQLSDLYQSQIDLRQNRIMTVLTVVTAIFMPLTLIAGWYGMNFIYMPELRSPYGYPGVIVVCLMIAIGCLLYFRKKKWL